MVYFAKVGELMVIIHGAFSVLFKVDETVGKVDVFLLFVQESSKTKMAITKII